MNSTISKLKEISFNIVEFTAMVLLDCFLKGTDSSRRWNLNLEDMFDVIAQDEAVEVDQVDESHD